MERMLMLHPTQTTDPVWAEETGAVVEVEMPSEDRVFVWLNWVIALAIAAAILFLQGRWLTPNVYTVPLRFMGWVISSSCQPLAVVVIT